MSTSHLDLPRVGDPQVEEVSDRVYAYVQPNGTWFINNTGFIVGDKAIISVDSCATERRTRAYLDAVRTVSNQPIKTLINTHHHGDHTYGNSLFGAATIVGHARCREETIAFGPPQNYGVWNDVDWGGLELAPPNLTFMDSVTLWADDLQCQVRYVGGPAHTTNDSLVWLPDRSTLYCGDLLFNHGTPFVLSGSVLGSIDVLENVVKPLGANTIIPGHGPVAGPDLIDKVLAYLRFVVDTAKQGLAANLSPLEAARNTDLGDFAELSDPERIVGNLHRAYADMSGETLGAPIDFLAALGDMITYNGGRPLSCRA